jgi:hypothetical protein
MTIGEVWAMQCKASKFWLPAAITFTGTRGQSAAAFAEVCDKANWDFDGVPFIWRAASLLAGFNLVVLPVILAVLAILWRWRIVSLVLAGYFLIWAYGGAVAWQTIGSARIQRSTQ